MIGWFLKTLTDRWAWRRQQLLDAYVALLEAADRFGLAASQMWAAASRLPRKTAELEAQGRELQLTHLHGLDVTMGRIRLIGDHRTGRMSLDLYVKSEVMFRRSVNRPTASRERYQEAATDWARSYQDLIDHGRQILRLRRFWDPRGGETFFEMSERRLNDLNRDEPLDHPLDE
jgi:hypothetical protein